jgi:outer membrane protein assembly factor BamB
MVTRLLLACSLCWAALAQAQTQAQDWPQFQQNAQRHGRLSDGPAGPYRARWIWLGPQHQLRNKESRAGWTDDLTGRDGYSYPMPKEVPMTFADGMQPVRAGGVLYALDEEGRAYAIDAADGSTKWVGQNPGGSVNSPVIAGSLLVCGSITGRITALDLADGKRAWALDTSRAITGSPALVEGTIYVANHGGYVYSINAADGAVNWKMRLGGPCVGGIAADETGCYVGAQDKFFYALNAKDGAVRAKTQLVGQGFRSLWPVLHEGKSLVQVVGTVCAGSEHVFDDVLQSGTSADDEQRNVLRWLGGDDNDGKWKWATPDMKHLYALDCQTLAEPFVVPNGPSEGCGTPADPPVVDNQGRVLLWWRTKFPTFTNDKPSFGTKFTLDISAMNLADGKRVPIDNGKFTGQGAETDNAFAFSVGGDTLFMRQRFRGTHGMNLKTSTHHLVQVASRSRDGGHWNAPVSYVAGGNVQIRTPQPAASAARTAPSIARDAIFFADPYCITCVESANPNPR